MIFPEDINKRINASKSLSTKDKTKLGVGLFFLLNIGIALFLVPTARGWGIPIWVPLVVQFILVVSIFILVWRVFIFKEDERMVEAKNKTQNSLAKFYFLRNLDSSETLTVGDKEFPVYEYDNGNSVMVMKFLLGENNNLRRKNNEIVLRKIFAILGEANLEFRQIVTKENFRTSPEAQSYIESLKEIEDPQLARVMREVTDALLDISETVSNVDVINLVIKTRSPHQIYSLDTVIRRISLVMKDYQTSFRRVTFLHKKPVLDLLKDYYGIEAIDPTLMSLSGTKVDYALQNKYVQVYALMDTEGNMLVRDQVIDTSSSMARELKFN